MKKICLSIPLFVILFGCKSLNKSQKGAAIGAAAGGVAGGLIAKNSVVGALIGAAVGGTAGYFIGKSMDNQARDLKQAVPDAEVTRVGEGNNLTFNSGLLFKINSAELSEGAKSELVKVVTVFNKYPETKVLLEGHTDDTGPDDYNMRLSQKRAESVADFLVSKGVNNSRLTRKWYGETQPKFPNDSEANREKNRRVEIGVSADEQMKKEATQGELKN
jgi:outer membrane protein OmpA-like peptidoglycan-associated protein